jgi:hypothetical protein
MEGLTLLEKLQIIKLDQGSYTVIDERVIEYTKQGISPI